MTALLRVLVAVSDHSLGGTSRSAVTFALAWKDAGADVTVLAVGGLRPSRRSAIRDEGIRVECDASAIGSEHWDILHLHHGADSPATRDWTASVLGAVGRETVVLTHNVFGQALKAPTPSSTVVGVLGDWVALQYRLQSPGRRDQLRVVPNPQDFDFFRPPSAGERDEARRTLGLRDDDHVILRLGSPIEDKWSASGYLDLVDQRGRSVIRLIGAPPSLEKVDREGVFVSPAPHASDEDVRREYWAADVLAVWSRRGESFGNVLLEALGCGLPVAYKAVPTRDNTPYEFRSIPGFSYVTRSRAWIAVSTAHQDRPKNGPHLVPYGRAAVTERLIAIVRDHRGDPEELLRSVLAAFARPRTPDTRSVVAAVLRHNPAMAALKSIRHRLLFRKRART